MAKKAVIIGASGLVGGELLQQLIDREEFSAIQVFVRKSLNIRHPKLEEIKTDFSTFETIKAKINGDVLFSCIGTTRAKTPDSSSYQRIDYDIPLKIAKLAIENKTKSFHLVSSIGANPQSSSFYLKLKGELEGAVKQLNFRDIHIYQPSLLTGKRKEYRPGERLYKTLSKLINPFLMGRLKKYKSIEASTVASAMINQSLKANTGIFIYTSDKIKELV